jgi:hypothetical protein
MRYAEGVMFWLFFTSTDLDQLTMYIRRYPLLHLWQWEGGYALLSNDFDVLQNHGVDPIILSSAIAEMRFKRCYVGFAAPFHWYSGRA